MPKRKRSTSKKARRVKRSYPTVPRAAGMSIGTLKPRSVMNGNGMIVTLRYVDDFSASQVSGDFAVVYSCNNIYDPYVTGAGHQPYGRDNISPLWKYYTVLSSKCTIHTGTNAATNNPGISSVSIRDNATPDSDITDILEPPNTTWKTFSYSDSSTVKGPIYTPQRILGVKPDDDLVRTNVGTSPANQAYYHLHATCPGGAATDNVKMVVVLEYRVLYSERAQLGRS